MLVLSKRHPTYYRPPREPKPWRSCPQPQPPGNELLLLTINISRSITIRLIITESPASATRQTSTTSKTWQLLDVSPILKSWDLPCLIRQPTGPRGLPKRCFRSRNHNWSKLCLSQTGKPVYMLSMRFSTESMSNAMSNSKQELIWKVWYLTFSPSYVKSLPLKDRKWLDLDWKESHISVLWYDQTTKKDGNLTKWKSRSYKS